MGLISDGGIHSHTDHLMAIMDMCKSQGIKEIYSLGDNIGHGPSPKETLELLEEYNVKSICGNHELYITEPDAMNIFKEHLISTGALERTIDMTNWIKQELTKEQIYYTYASEADLLNVALFGLTASEWRKQNKDLEGNMRDYASVEQLLVLANMESYNAMLVEQGLDSKNRIVLLNNMAKSQMKVLTRNVRLVENK